MRGRRGADLEKLVEARLRDIDPKTRLSINSGATFGDGDFSTKHFLGECKERSTQSFTINHLYWDQVNKQATKELKDPILINRNKNKDIFVTMSLETFEWLYQEYLDGLSEEDGQL